MSSSPVTEFEQQNLFAAIDISDNNEAQADAAEAYSLTQLEIFNWGPFSGFHRIHFDAYGSSLIGQTGSGKTTLVDAIMTLICAQPKSM